MTYRNALVEALAEAQHITGHTGDNVRMLLSIWSERNPLVLADKHAAYMRGLLDEAGATKCRELFDAALAGEKVLRPDRVTA